MVERKMQVVNDGGLHARSAALFVQLASKYKAKIWVEKDEKRVNAKSIMGIMSLGVSKGMSIMVGADGVDENDAVVELANLVESKFGEKM